MSLQKRPLPPQIQRTTSMSGITVDMSDVESPLPFDPQKPILKNPVIFNNPVVVGTSEYDDRATAMFSPRHRKTIREDNFLTTCGLCRRRLSHGHDIYMYRGDTAFCSVECREEQMKHDERKENCSSSSSSSVTTSETIAAA